MDKGYYDRPRRKHLNKRKYSPLQCHLAQRSKHHNDYFGDAYITATLPNGFSTTAVITVLGSADLSVLPLGNSEIYLEDEQYHYFQFTPAEDGYYYVCSDSYLDTAAELYDINFVQLAVDDDSGDGANFNLGYSLIAGETYTSSGTGSRVSSR